VRKFALLLTVLNVALFAGEELVYTTEKGPEKYKTTWSAEEKGDEMHVTGKNDFSTTTLTCSAKTSTFSEFKIDSKRPNDSYTAEIKSGRLVAQKTKDGNELKKEYKIDQPWIQEFGYGLKSFVKSGDKSFKFVILNPDNLDLNKMIAIREETETLKVEGHEIPALKIRVTLQGFKHIFWKGYVWFDEKTNTLVKYSGNEGPNTPTTTILLTDTKKTLSP